MITPGIIVLASSKAPALARTFGAALIVVWAPVANIRRAIRGRAPCLKRALIDLRKVRTKT